MTAPAPVWMASPPEVHSALLSTGAGPGPLLAAAAAWSAMGAEYTEAADDLMALLGAVGASAWQGPAAESYLRAHAPYLSWLRQAAADSAAAAARCETVAGAYRSALSAMPTLSELVANHLTHGVLVATNFFGLNTIPIALNEADYVRMWVQAATTMSIYQAVSGAAVASTPQPPPAPAILKADAHGGDNQGTDPTVNDPLDQLIAQLLQTASNGQVNWDPAHAMVNGIPYDQYVDPNQPLFWLVRALELFEDFQQLGVNFQQNPALAVQYLVQLAEFDWPTHLAEIATWAGQSPQLFAAALAVVVAPVGAAGGFAGLAGLAGLPQPVAPIPALPAGPGGHALPAIGTVPPAPAVPGTVSASVPAAPAGAATGAAPAVAGPPPAGGSTFVPPYLIGGPGIGSGSAMGAAARAARKASEPDGAAAAAAAPEAHRGRGQARRRRRAANRGHADQFMTMGVGVDPEWQRPDDDPAAADRGAGTLGVAGSAANGRFTAVGMARLDDAFGGGPQQPMVPGSWGEADTAR